MLNLTTKIAAITLAALAFFSPVANAIVFPVLSIDEIGTDAGMVYNGTTLTIDAHALAIELDAIPIGVIDINPDAPVTVTAASISLLGGTSYITGAGTLLVGTGGSLLNASFDSMLLLNSGGSTGNFLADLTYNSGSLAGTIGSGEFTGGFTIGSCTAPITGGCDFSQAFTADLTGAKAGAVVPVPAAVWLFGSGLLGLVGVARRKTA